MAPEWNEAHFKCEQCGRHLSVTDADTTTVVVLPDPWRRFYIKGWVGGFIACSFACEEGVRARKPEGPT